MTTDRLRHSQLHTQVTQAITAFLRTVKSGKAMRAGKGLCVEICFEGHWPHYVDATSILRECADGEPVVCHTQWRFAPDSAALGAIVLKTLNAPPGGQVRHVSFIEQTAIERLGASIALERSGFTRDSERLQ